jgi:hypothetical protein
MIAASLRHSCGILAACLGHPMILVPMILVPMILVPMILVACGRLLCIRQISFRRALRGAQVQGGGFLTRLAAGCASRTEVLGPCPCPSALCFFPSLYCLLATEETGNAGLERVSTLVLFCPAFLLGQARQGRAA